VQQTYDPKSYGHAMFAHCHHGKFKLLCHITHEIIANNFSTTIFQPYIVLYATIDEQLKFQILRIGQDMQKQKSCGSKLVQISPFASMTFMHLCSKKFKMMLKRKDLSF
jgi:hypothetical protein